MRSADGLLLGFNWHKDSSKARAFWFGTWDRIEFHMVLCCFNLCECALNTSVFFASSQVSNSSDPKQWRIISISWSFDFAAWNRIRPVSSSYNMHPKLHMSAFSLYPWGDRKSCSGDWYKSVHTGFMNPPKTPLGFCTERPKSANVSNPCLLTRTFAPNKPTLQIPMNNSQPVDIRNSLDQLPKQWPYLGHIELDLID